MKKMRLLLFLCTLAIQSHAQFSPQVMDRASGALPTTVRDRATVSVYYQFTQQAVLNNIPVFLTDTTVLRIGNIYSLYYNWSSALRDSVFRATSAQIDSDQIRTINVIRDADEFENILRNTHGGVFSEQDENRSTTRFFKNRHTNTITSIDGDITEMFLVEEVILPQEWTVFPDTMTILNYLCFKATTTFRGRNYNAWFTLDIPINDGPWKIYGLPGLILRLEDEDGLFVHQAIGLTSHAERPIAMRDDAYTRITNEQLQRWIENQRQNITMRVVSGGIMTISPRRNQLTFHRREIGY